MVDGNFEKYTRIRKNYSGQGPRCPRLKFREIPGFDGIIAGKVPNDRLKFREIPGFEGINSRQSTKWPTEIPRNARLRLQQKDTEFTRSSVMSNDLPTIHERLSLSKTLNMQLYIGLVLY